jgi:hypothetical protein
LGLVTSRPNKKKKSNLEKQKEKGGLFYANLGRRSKRKTSRKYEGSEWSVMNEMER